jgi:hypothetical protein
MDKSSKPISGKTEIAGNGIFIQGVVVSSMAQAWNRKDGSGKFVEVTHEIALQPGIAVLSQYFDPAKDIGIKLDDLEVLEFPRLHEFQPVLLKALRYEIRNDSMRITKFEQLN